MFSQRGMERLAAALLLLTVVGVVVSVFTYPEPLDTSTREIRGTLLEIEEDSRLFLTSTAFFVFVSLIAIPLAGALYLAFRPFDRSLALLGAFGFLAAGVLNASLAMARFALEPIAQGFVDATATQATTLSATRDAILVADARVVGTMIEYMASMAGMGIALGVLAYGVLMVRTGALPRWMGWVGVISGAVIVLSWIEFAHDNIEGVLLIGQLIGLMFAVFAGGYLLLNGTRQGAATEQTEQAAR